MRALNIAATGMAAQQMRVEVISHNLANMNTTAYNARRAEFADLHYQQVQRPGTINSSDGTILPAGIQLGLGVRPSAVSVQVGQGSVVETGNALDVAIEGKGYLEITLPNGDSAYTRDGALKQTGEGLIVTSDGFAVVPEITIPNDAKDITINVQKMPNRSEEKNINTTFPLIASSAPAATKLTSTRKCPSPSSKQSLAVLTVPSLPMGRLEEARPGPWKYSSCHLGPQSLRP